MMKMNNGFEYMNDEGYTAYHRIMNLFTFFAGLGSVMYGDEPTVSKEEALKAVRLWTGSDEVVDITDQFLKDEETRISLWWNDDDETLEVSEYWDVDLSHHLLVGRYGDVAVCAGFRNYVSIR